MELLVNNFLFVLSFILSISFGFFIFSQRPKSGNIKNILYFLISIFIAIWQVAYIVGTNIQDSELSRVFFTFTLFITFALALSAHLVVVLANRFENQKNNIFLIYTATVLLLILYSIFPKAFLLTSENLFYFSNFFVSGNLHVLFDLYIFSILLYIIYIYVSTHSKADYQTKNHLKYFIVSIFYIYAILTIVELPSFGIILDPIIVSLIGLYSIPMSYAILKYEVIDTRNLFKRVLYYALSIVAITLLILFIIYLNNIFVTNYPELPIWLVPLLFSVLAVFIVIFISNKTSEIDILKYQFIDVVTHKFRTPITQIKWATEVLEGDLKVDEKIKLLSGIKEAGNRLFQLTDLLSRLNKSDSNEYLYSYSIESLPNMIDDVLDNNKEIIKDRKFVIEKNIPANLPNIYVDLTKTVFTLQTLIDNALIYTPGENGKVTISAKIDNDNIILSIKDTGIGISKEDLSHLFKKFFRTKEARQAHAEGMGIGTFLSRDIMRRQGGDLWVESEGKNKGSTFFIKFPIAK